MKVNKQAVEEAAKHIREQLKTGSWPQVAGISVHTHKTKKGAGSEWVKKLETEFQKKNCQNMAIFISLIHSEEQHLGKEIVCVRLILAPHDVDFSNPKPEDIVKFFSIRDITMGRMDGTKSALEWMSSFCSSVDQDSPPEFLQFFDKIFGGAIEVFKQIQGKAN